MTASIGKRNGVGAILRVEAHGFLAWGAWIRTYAILNPIQARFRLR
jgi:hypothetical protein